jgi:serine phosphatase RsbU (regulator of sigma subunit)
MAFGYNSYDKSDFKQALVHFLEAAKIRESTIDLKGRAASNTWIGNVYNSGLKMPAIALPYYEKALKIQKEINDESSLPFTYNNIGNVYYFQKKYKEALFNYFKSAELKEKQNNTRGLAASYDNIGNVYFEQKNYLKAEEFYKKALLIREEFGDKKGMTTSYINIGNLFYVQKNFKAAIDLHLKALEAAKDIGNKEVMKEASYSLSASYEELGDFKKAFEFNRYSSMVSDSIINSTFTEQISEMQTKYEVEKKDLQLNAQEKQIEKEKTQRYFIISVLLFFVVLFIVAIWAFIQKRKNSNLLQEKNKQLEGANQKISHQKEELFEKQKEIVDSINYAKKIQNALLASEKLLMKNLVDYFIMFKPKDIVSGDFTWATIKDNKFYLACCDSTGHGVPGAFMSLLNIGFLSEAIKERNILSPGEIFNYVRARLIETIGNDDQKDGFDGILVCMNIDTKEISYAAANNSPVLIRNKELILLKANKMPVGDGIKTDSFDTFPLTYEKGDSLYLYTDGYPDQFGGPKGKKFKYKQLEELLSANSDKPTRQQKEILDRHFESWRGSLEQVDDVCVIGIHL